MHIINPAPASPEVAAEIRFPGQHVLNLLRTNIEGGALVESALVLPILLLIVTGIFTFGTALNNYMELTDAVGSGARQLAISRGYTLDPCATVVTAVHNAAPSLAQADMTFSFSLNGTAYTGTSCSSTNTTSGAPADLVQGQPAQVTVTYPCKLPVFGLTSGPACSVKAQTTELVQ